MDSLNGFRVDCVVQFRCTDRIVGVSLLVGGALLIYTDNVDVNGVQTFRRFPFIIGNLLSRFQASIAVHADVGVVNKQVLAAGVWTNEAITLGVIEPFHFPGCHNSSPSVGTTSVSVALSQLLLLFTAEVQKIRNVLRRRDLC